MTVNSLVRATPFLYYALYARLGNIANTFRNAKKPQVARLFECDFFFQENYYIVHSHSGLMSQRAAPINGIDVPELVKVINSVAQDAEKGKTRWRAKVRWQGGTKSDVYIRDFAPIRMDEPSGLTGTNTAPNMVEYTIGALGACWITGFAANASARGIKIKDLEVELQGDINLRGFFGLSDKVNPGYDAIKARVRLEADAPRERLEELYRDVLKTSPVGNTLSRPVEIDSELVTQ